MKNIMHTTKVSIPEKDRIELCTILNISLASAIDLYAQLKQAHWNIKGPEFISLHKLFDELAEEIEDHIDILAERIEALGGTAFGTIQATSENTALRVYPMDIFIAKDHLAHLTHNFAILGEHCRTNIHKSEEYTDIATGDIYIAFVRFLDKSLWFLEARLQK